MTVPATVANRVEREIRSSNGLTLAAFIAQQLAVIYRSSVASEDEAQEADPQEPGYL